jgi:hypothetical protein
MNGIWAISARKEKKKQHLSSFRIHGFGGKKNSGNNSTNFQQTGFQIFTLYIREPVSCLGTPWKVSAHQLQCKVVKDAREAPMSEMP